MRKRGYAVLIAWLMTLGGCHVVYSTTPVGGQPAKLAASDWEGVWTHRDGAVTVAAIDAEKGMLDIGWVEKKQDRLVFEQYRVQVRQSGEWLFGNVQDPDQSHLYVWGRLRKEDNQIVLWAPQFSTLKTLVERKVLRGAVTENGEDLVLDNPDPVAVQRLMRGTDGIPLDWENPIVFNRLSR